MKGGDEATLLRALGLLQASRSSGPVRLQSPDCWLQVVSLRARRQGLPVVLASCLACRVQSAEYRVQTRRHADQPELRLAGASLSSLGCLTRLPSPRSLVNTTLRNARHPAFPSRNLPIGFSASRISSPTLDVPRSKGALIGRCCGTVGVGGAYPWRTTRPPTPTDTGVGRDTIGSEVP
jgi:hypothetical protein